MADVCEDEDLDALRLAALQTLKKKSSAEQVIEERHNRNVHRNQFSRFKRLNKMGPRGKPHRPVSSNLIPLTCNTETLQPIHKEEPNSKLTLPQDKYSKETPDPVPSKFDRYKDTDESECDDTEDELLKGSEDDEEGKLVKSDSLEALMQELDDEIQGKPNVDENEADEAPKDEPVESVKVELKDEVQAPTKDKSPEPVPNKSLPPVRRRKREFRPIRNNRPAFQPRMFMPLNPEPPPLPYEPMMMVCPPLCPPIIGPIFHDPIPLRIDADTLRTQTLAPLSPRSAAFVLENRAIIEKRKRSPRRSYSRSPSPWERDDYRKRSPSPIRRHLGRKYSVSPRARPQKSVSVSPRRRSPSPRRRLPSPSRRSLSPRKRSLSPRPSRKDLSKKPIHKRLGFKPGQKPEDSPNDDVKKPLDPVLEARKKKFESSEIKIREGVIKLKLKKSDESVDGGNPEPEALNKGPVDDDEGVDIDMEYTRLSPELNELENDVEEGTSKNLVSQHSPLEAEEEEDLVNSTKLSLKRPRLKLKTSTGRKIKKRKTSKKESKMFDKRIEIKIKNPTKYISDEEKIDARVSKALLDFEDSEDDTTIIIENDEDVAENENISTKESDLRTQLSRKRAQKHSKTLIPDAVPTRLLKNALQNVLPLEKRKRSKEKKKVANGEGGSGNIRKNELLLIDGKLPIHMRLGLTSKRKEHNLSRK